MALESSPWQMRAAGKSTVSRNLTADMSVGFCARSCGVLHRDKQPLLSFPNQKHAFADGISFRQHAVLALQCQFYEAGYSAMVIHCAILGPCWPSGSEDYCMSRVLTLYLPEQALPGGPKHYKIDRDCSIVTDTRNITTAIHLHPFRSQQASALIHVR